MATPDPILIDVPERIDTDRLLLEAPRPGLGPVLNEAICESVEQLKPWMSWAQTEPGLEEAEAQIRRMHADFVSRRSLNYPIYLRAAGGSRGQLLGCASLPRLDWKVRSFEIGYWLRTSAQGQGYATEVVHALSRMAFETLRARRVEIRTDDNNLRSRAVAERCGFEFEGVLRRDSLSPSGEPRDTWVYSRIA